MQSGLVLFALHCFSAMFASYCVQSWLIVGKGQLIGETVPGMPLGS